MAFPTITETHGFLTCGWPHRDAQFGIRVAPTTFLPLADDGVEEDPGWFSGIASADLQHTTAIAGSSPATDVTEEVDRGVSDDH